MAKPGRLGIDDYPLVGIVQRMNLLTKARAQHFKIMPVNLFPLGYLCRVRVARIPGFEALFKLSDWMDDTTCFVDSESDEAVETSFGD